MGLITPETRALSRGEQPPKPHHILRFLNRRPTMSKFVVESAEGLRWAHAATYLPDRAHFIGKSAVEDQSLAEHEEPVIQSDEVSISEPEN